MVTMNMVDNTEPPAKKRCQPNPDRVTLDVGGKEFITSVSTLQANSSYFASLFSENWSNNRSGDEAIFLDQDPAAFSKLLIYMRRGLIKIDDIDVDLLSQAEFLGVERLLLAVKVRAYSNLHPSLTISDEETLAGKFDQEYGGILGAISRGLLPGSMIRTENVAKKDYAIVEFASFDDPQQDYARITFEPKQGDLSRTPHGRIIGALNCLHHFGFTQHEKQMEYLCGFETTATYSRLRQSTVGDTQLIFLPACNEMFDPKEQNWRKQFAMMLMARDYEPIIHAPAEFHEDARERNNPAATAIIRPDCDFFERHGFTHREEGLEKKYKWCFDTLLKQAFPDRELGHGDHMYSDMWFKIFSRKIAYLPSDGTFP